MQRAVATRAQTLKLAVVGVVLDALEVVHDVGDRGMVTVPVEWVVAKRLEG